MCRGVMLCRERIHEKVDNYNRFKNWLKNNKKLKISEARIIGIDALIDEYEDWCIDLKFKDRRPFQERTGINYKTFSDWVRRNTGKKMKELTEEEKEDLVIDYK